MVFVWFQNDITSYDEIHFFLFSLLTVNLLKREEDREKSRKYIFHHGNVLFHLNIKEVMNLNILLQIVNEIV